MSSVKRGIDKLDNMIYDSLMARYDGCRKVARNKALRDYALANPNLSYKEIGQVFGVSGSRAYRIIHGNQKANAKLPNERSRICLEEQHGELG